MTTATIVWPVMLTVMIYLGACVVIGFLGYYYNRRK